MPASIYRHARDLPRHGRATLVLIGNFDGVHKGHQAVLRQALASAKALELLPVVLTFEPHPAEVLASGGPPRLTRALHKAALLGELSESLAVIAHPFTLQLARNTPEEFVREVLVGHLGAKVVLVGDDFRFGAGRSGDLKTLVELGRELGFEARGHALVGDPKGSYSSSRVRRALAVSDLDEVFEVLGRPHAVSGEVVRGSGKGRTLGFATANLADITEALPSNGVYIVRVGELDNMGQEEPLGLGVANIGNRPTLEAGFSVEVHLLDFERDLYGARLRLHLLAHLRSERKFAGVAELIQQVQADIAQARDYLATVRR
jgi:riboflavin kinase/FMN adenylyltransferase